MTFSNYETSCVASYIECNTNYKNCIKLLITELRVSYSQEECISILEDSIRDICEYDINESVKEASLLTRNLLFATLGVINYKELANFYVSSLFNK